MPGHQVVAQWWDFAWMLIAKSLSYCIARCRQACQCNVENLTQWAQTLSFGELHAPLSLGSLGKTAGVWVVSTGISSELPRYGRYSVTFNESETGALGQVYPAWWLRNPEVGGFPTVELCKLQLHGEVIKAYGGSQFYLARDEHAQQSCQL